MAPAWTDGPCVGVAVTVGAEGVQVGPSIFPFTTCTQDATEGTPLEFTMKSMYHPGGARFGSAGEVAETVPLSRVNSRST